MSKILLNDCPDDIAGSLSQLLGEKTLVTAAAFRKDADVAPFDLVGLYAETLTGDVQEKIKHLRYQTRFRGTPVVLLQPKKPQQSGGPFLRAGATETLFLSEPAGAVVQILQSLMTPNRNPREEELAYLTPFIASTKDVFSTMASMDISYKTVYFQNDHRMLGDISGVIGLSGDAEGTVVITFYWQLAQRVISSIMGVAPEDISADLLNDGVGEIINMISGSAKRFLADTPYYFQLSLPTVILGWQHEIGHPENASVAVLVFDVEDQSFAVQVSLTPRTKSVNMR